MERPAPTQHTLRCPKYDCGADLTVRTNSDAPPSRRHLDVVSCSLLPSASFLPPTRTAYFAGMDPALPYLSGSDWTPCHSAEVACSTPCLAVLNAAECGAAEPVRCTSGVSDALEMARQVQSPALTRVMWSYFA
jgi:hypothetical protein